jgi:Heavy metal binding domain
MKKRVVLAALALIVFTMTNILTLSAEEKKGKHCAGTCCGGEAMAMAEMQDHSQHKQGQQSKDSTTQKGVFKAAKEYTCPMHPEVRSSNPGKCPKCKMDLVEVKKQNKPQMKHKM